MNLNHENVPCNTAGQVPGFQYAMVLVPPDKRQSMTGTSKDYGYIIVYYPNPDVLASEVHSSCGCGPGYRGLGTYRREDNAAWVWFESDALEEYSQTRVIAGDTP